MKSKIATPVVLAASRKLGYLPASKKSQKKKLDSVTILCLFSDMSARDSSIQVGVQVNGGKYVIIKPVL